MWEVEEIHMMKKMLAFLLCLMLLPLYAFAAEGVDDFSIKGYKMGFSYSFDYEEKYALINYATDYESGNVVVHSEDGHFEGDIALQCTYRESKVRATVKSLDGKDLDKDTSTVPSSAAPKAQFDQPDVEKKATKVKDLTVESILGGVHITFTAEGHESVLIKYRSSQQKGEMLLYPGENYQYEADIMMPYTYAKTNVYVDVYNKSGSSKLAEGEAPRGYELIARETEVTPGRLSGITVCIDPGHQGSHRTVTEERGPGLSGTVTSSGGQAQGVSTRRKESIVVLEVAYLLRDELMRQGANVVMTRSTEEEWVSNLDRCRIAEEGGADFMLRLHCDNRENKNTKGIGIFCPLASTYAKEVADYETYKTWADALLYAMQKAVGYGENRGQTYFNNAYVGNNWAKMPCFLIEIGFMSNAEEDYKMSESTYQQKLCEGMAQGVYEMGVMRGLIEE
ncbi:MAG: N-acetylmuramoyl-L-alanine amidase [Clostridiales bacterium]|nr:N-acetylmuramoyl-L-alanine amidase [Clostridiales bacterium]